MDRIPSSIREWLTLVPVGCLLLHVMPGTLAAQAPLVSLPGDKKESPTQVPPNAIGMAAIVPTPRNVPNFTATDVFNMFQESAAIAKGAVMMYQWSDPGLPNAVRSVVPLARQYGLTPILGLSPMSLDRGRKELDPPKSLRGKTSFADKDVQAAFIKTAQELGQLKPPYLCLATEINALGMQRPAEYTRFVELYKRAYRAVKQISPGTKVFVSFQYDWLRKLDHQEPGKLKEHARLIDAFRPELDLVAITSYPYQYYSSPADMPGNYYSYLRTYLKPGDQVMIMEIGWTSVGRGAELKQKQFVERLPALVAKLSPRVTTWALLHDITHPAFTKELGSVGLFTSDDKPKPALEAWKKIAEPARPKK
jgi:hypothetical protein